MKNMFKKRINKNILYPLIIFIIISLLSIFSASNIILVIKQIIWYILGFILINYISKIDIKNIYKYYKYLYILGNLLLLLLLIFATPVNNSKCWFTIGPITIQPSEFMKLILIITNALVINNNRNNKEYITIINVLVLTLIPSILTFKEPDTGMVIIYFIISFTMLFISNINIKYFTISSLFLLLFISIFLSLYFYNSNTFINIFGTNSFYRIDRLLEFINGNGYQLSNALISIGSASILGHGFNNTPVYFPESETDFIFSVFTTNYGLLGALILIITIIYFDITIIKIAINIKRNKDKLLISGILSMMIYQQIQIKKCLL